MSYIYADARDTFAAAGGLRGLKPGFNTYIMLSPAVANHYRYSAVIRKKTAEHYELVMCRFNLRTGDYDCFKSVAVQITATELSELLSSSERAMQTQAFGLLGCELNRRRRCAASARQQAWIASVFAMLDAFQRSVI